MAGLSPEEMPPGLALLFARRSSHLLCEPAPEGEDLARIFRAATRVPDFQHLRPYRLIAARGEGRAKLGEILHAAAQAAGKSEKTLARARQMPLRAPLVIVVAATPKPSQIVPVFDQQLCAGCTVLAMQLAIQALGFASVWRSGWPMYDDTVHRRLGLAAGDQIVGFLYVGTRSGEASVADAAGELDLQWLEA